MVLSDLSTSEAVFGPGSTIRILTHDRPIRQASFAFRKADPLLDVSSECYPPSRIDIEDGANFAL